MTNTYDRGQLDWLVELTGAAALAIAAAFAAARLAPATGWPVATAVLVAGGGIFAATFVVMRTVPAEPLHFALPDFAVAELPEDLLLPEPVVVSDELMLDQPLDSAASEALAELLLDDPLPAPEPGSRVVHLFAVDRMPTAGQLKHRIDRHLAGGRRPATASPTDAADALSEALAELRRSLRQA